MKRYSSLIYSICYKITNDYFDAQDLTQDTFISVYENLPSFDGNNEKAWISRIATNKCLDYLKNSSRKSLPTEDSYFNGMISQNPTPEDTVLDKSTQEKLLLICKELKPPYDEIAFQYFYKEMTMKEISETTGKKIKTIQTQIYRAKIMVKSLWRKEMHHEK